MTFSITFRCPEDLLQEIDDFGQQHYPARNASGCDRSKTLISILQAGLSALSEGSVDIPGKTSKTSQTIETEAIKSALRDELLSELMAFVRLELQDVRQELDERMTALGEQLVVREPAESPRHKIKPDYEAVRDRVLQGWKVAKRAETKERIQEALDRFITELDKLENAGEKS